MRDPDKSSRQTSLRATEMAARTYLRAHLGWLRGLPTGLLQETGTRSKGPPLSGPPSNGLPWETLPRIGSASATETFIVDRERLRATEYARNSARRQFPRALERVVGDVEAWSKRIDSQLNVLKSIIHRGAAFPSLENVLSVAALRRSSAQRVSAKAKQQPHLADIYAGLIWLHWHDERALLRALDAVPAGALLTLREHSAASPHDMQRLVELAGDGTLQSVFGLLADDRIWTLPIPTPDLADAIKTKLNATAPVTSNFVTGVGHWPPPHLGLRLLKYVLELRDADRKARNRELSVLEQVLPATRLAAFDAWWQDASRVARHLRRFDRLNVYTLSAPDDHEYRTLQSDARSLVPPQLDWPRLRRSLQSWRGATPAATAALHRCLHNLDAARLGSDAVDRFVARWSDEVTARKALLLTQALLAEADVLQAMKDATAAQITWVADVVSQQLIDGFLWSSTLAMRQIVSLARALIKLVAPPRSWAKPEQPFFAEHRTFQTIMELLQTDATPDAIAAAIAAAPPNWDTIETPSWLLLWSLADDNADLFAAWVRDWPNDTWDDRLSPELGFLAKNRMLAQVLANALTYGHVKRLARLANLSRLVRSLRLPWMPQTLVAASTPQSFRAYPEALQPVLAELVAWDERAEQAADDILGDDFPSSAKMQEELARIQRLAAIADGAKKTSLEKRIARLKQQFETPITITERRLDNLRAKLHRRVSHAALQHLETSLLQAVQTGLGSEFGTQPSAEWLDRPEVIAVLCGLPALSRHHRSMAMRLLSLTFGGPPWDLREEPANQGFLTRMASLGLDMSSWLDGIEPIQVSDDSRRLTLRLERDPLAVMGMGAPFGTCLSPGNFNFYSAVVNAADINKAVIFARDDAGTIQARCLLALADNGRMLTFNVYAHAPTEALRDAFRTFAITLAARIGTSLSALEAIRPLLSAEWYDDGSQDMTGQFAFLEAGSAFLAEQATLQPSNAVSRVQAAMDGAPITPLVITRLLHVEPFSDRLELLVPMLRHIGDPARLDGSTLRHLTPVVSRSGDTELALRMLDLSSAAITRDGWGWNDTQVLEQLMSLGHAQKALSILRRTRPTGVRTWEDETDERAYLAIKALCAMGRSVRALDIARRAARANNTAVIALLADMEKELAIILSQA